MCSKMKITIIDIKRPYSILKVCMHSCYVYSRYNCVYRCTVYVCTPPDPSPLAHYSSYLPFCSLKLIDFNFFVTWTYLECGFLMTYDVAHHLIACTCTHGSKTDNNLIPESIYWMWSTPIKRIIANQRTPSFSAQLLSGDSKDKPAIYHLSYVNISRGWREILYSNYLAYFWIAYFRF